MADCYYLDGARNQQGPVLADEIARLIRSGTIRRDTLIWYAGMPDWRPAGQVNEFASLFAQGGPPRPPAAPYAPQPQWQDQAPRYPAGSPERMAPERMAPVAAAGAPTDRLVAQLRVWGLFWRTLLVFLGNALVIPAPWTSTTIYRYFGENTWLPDGRRLAFSGKAGDIWYVFIGLAILGLVGQIIQFGLIVTLPLSYVLNYLAFRWLCAKIGSEDGSVKLAFTGGFWGYFGWNLLVLVSFITIIGWAWVLKLFLQWLCRNVSGTVNFEFVGTGWGILWRTIVTGLACGLLIPIPWVLRWLTVWFIGQVRVENLAAHFD
jgi:hypothetical protein